MKFISLILALAIIISFSGPAYCVRTSDDSDNSGSSALGGALMGGLLGAGLGAAVGSASGHAGTGAAIGGGVGAVGGTLLAADKAKKEKEAAQYEERYQQEQYRDQQYQQQQYQPVAAPNNTSSDMKVKKRVIKQYDSEGNIVSQKEVAS